MRAGSGVLLRVLWSQERSQFQFFVTNAVIIPLTVCYYTSRVGGATEAGLQWALGGGLTLSLAIAALQPAAFGILHDRFMGRAGLLQSLPISVRSYFAAHVALAWVQVAAFLCGSLIAVWALDMAALSLATLGPALVLLLGAALGLVGVSVAIGSFANSLESGAALIMVSATPIVVASPVFYERESLPALVQGLAYLSPYTAVAEAYRSALSGAALAAPAYLALVAFGAIGLAAGFLQLRRATEFGR